MKTFEQLYYCTTRIMVFNGGRVSTGTAFFFNLEIDKKTYPLLITNKHVLFNKQNCNFQIELHTSLTQKKIINVNPGFWLFHPTEDLAFIFLGPILNTNLQEDEKLENVFLMEKNLVLSKDIAFLDAIEEVIMVGYPKGIYDEFNNFPVIRKGITSSPLTLNYNGKKQGLIDIALFPGSSGSPVFVYRNYVGGDLRLKNDYVRFIGVNFQGYSYKNSVIKASNDFDSVDTFINLALYIKAECILDFKDTIKSFEKELSNINDLVNGVNNDEE